MTDGLRTRALALSDELMGGSLDVAPRPRPAAVIADLLAELDRVTAERDGLAVDIEFYTGRLAECGNRIIAKDEELDRVTAERDKWLSAAAAHPSPADNPRQRP